MVNGALIRAVTLMAVLAAPAAAQSGGGIPGREAVERERAAYVDWLRTAPQSPFAAIALTPLGDGVTLGGADADVPLAGVAPHRVVPQGGVAALEGPDGRRLLPRNRTARFGDHTLLLAGPRGRLVLAVFGPVREAAPTFYDYDPAFAFTGPMAPSAAAETLRVLAADGIEVEATVAGTVSVPVNGGTHLLRVLRMPVPGTDEHELEIYFRDATNAGGTYPAGRFVAVVPLPDGRYRLDFNRARNPFCAYSTVYPCPLPWPGNTLPMAVTAGERYEGGGLEAPPVGDGE